MKKFLSFLLTFVMLFSLTMPAMAAEVTGNTEGEVSASYTPTPATITGVSITVDGTTYTEGNVTIYSDSTVVYTATGTYFANVSADNVLLGAYNMCESLNSSFWSVDQTANTAICDLSSFVSVVFSSSNNYEVTYYNNYTADPSDRTANSTGIYVTYNEGTKPVPYTITVNTAENGTVTADKSTAIEGETVTLTWTVDSAYKLSNIVITAADGSEVTITDTGLTAWTFVMPSSNVTVTATFEKLPVTSVEITWGSMSFTYSDEQVTQEDGSTADKGWSPDSAEGAATVTVKNTGETTFTAQATYTPYEGYESITGSFDPASKELAPPSGEQAGEEYTFTLVLSGKPTKALSGDKIGKVTITINEAAEG